MDLRSIWADHRSRFFVRLLAGVLAAALPIMVLLAVLLSRSASATIADESSISAENLARAATSRLEGWLEERNRDLTHAAALLGGRPVTASSRALLPPPTPSDPYSVLEVVDLGGRVIAATDPQLGLDVGGQDWFQAAAAGPVLSPIRNQGGHLRWFVSAPVNGADGRPEAVVVAVLRPAALATTLRDLDANTRASSQLVAVDQDHHLVYRTGMPVGSDATMIAAGALQTQVRTAAVEAGLGGRSGAVRGPGENGDDVLAGYDTVQGVDWAVVVSENAGAALSPIDGLRTLAVVLVVAGALLLTGFAVVFARRTTRPITELSQAADRVAAGDLSVRVHPGGAAELVRLGAAFNGMVQRLSDLVERLRIASADSAGSALRLSSASEQLAASTVEQSSAATETSASMEELARAAGSVAQTLDEVAAQAEETRQSLEQAQEDMRVSSERTLSLATRVTDINAILTLINDLSDQTNLLALNAAIEAARAGEAGRGFAVVADEVRRLAERSKTSAGEIGHIVQGTQAETNATVMAMEKGAKQMQAGLALMERVVESCAQVRMTTQQQRSATEQVVSAMEQVTVSSRQVSATAQEIAAAAAAQAGLATDLDVAVGAGGGR
ncbi:MAG TPA: methyl-accepting chemotaxis protein [Candidatus Dormibacteraeota bacterium]|jgi:methyl-accepting chemotaxis protein